MNYTVALDELNAEIAKLQSARSGAEEVRAATGSRWSAVYAGTLAGTAVGSRVRRFARLTPRCGVRRLQAEVDYLAGTMLGPSVQDAFLTDLAEGLYTVEFGGLEDLTAAKRVHRRHRALKLGLVDACVVAIAERFRAEAIATLDVRHFGAIKIAGNPRLLPRDL